MRVAKVVIRLGPALLALAGLPVPAAAELPEGVRAMIEAARESGDPETFAAVVAVAKKTHPDDAEEIAAIESEFRAAREAETARLAAAEQEELREADVFENWSGKGELGAFRSSGNSDSIGVTAGLALTREGIDWTHKLRGRADYQRTNGVTSREQFFAAYEPRYQTDESLFYYGLAQFERDRFQGFSGRYSVSGGLGHKLLDSEAVDLAVKAGPAFRRTEFVDGGSEDSLAALLGLDFDWRIDDGVTLTQNADLVAEGGGAATVFLGSSNTSINLITGLDAKVSDSLTARAAYTIEYNSDPPPGAVPTDTMTRFTLVYGF